MNCEVARELRHKAPPKHATVDQCEIGGAVQTIAENTRDHQRSNLDCAASYNLVSSASVGGALFLVFRNGETARDLRQKRRQSTRQSINAR